MMKATAIRRLLHSRKSRLTCSALFPNTGVAYGFSLCRTFISGSETSPLKGTSCHSACVDFTIFKGKAALSVVPVLPTFVKRDSGIPVREKMGVVMLKFMPAIGQRKYASEKKQMFALSPTEIGSLISLNPGESCEFIHDPSMKSSLEGQVKKSLNVTPATSEHGSYFFSLSVSNSVLKQRENMSVPVTKAEFAVMRTALNFILPRIMGWDQLVPLPASPNNSQRPLKIPLSTSPNNSQRPLRISVPASSNNSQRPLRVPALQAADRRFEWNT